MTTGEPSKIHGEFSSIIGGIEEVVGNAVGATEYAKRGKEEKAKGDAEYQAAQAKGFVDGVNDRVGGKVDNVLGAVTGDSAQEASGKLRHDKGVAQQELNQ